jgi:hypothetical protein
VGALIAPTPFIALTYLLFALYQIGDDQARS